jgi:pyridoxine/pyridoxamine 5'-phosphate oxidase
MTDPKASRPYWPDALATAKDSTTGLKPWRWALERLQNSHNYWIATTRTGSRPHLMIVWGVWWQDAFWFSTGLRSRKAKNIASAPSCVIAIEQADEAVIVEGTAQQVADRDLWMPIVQIYKRKYGEDLAALVEKSNSAIFRVQPQVVFAQDEHAENFVESVTRWTFE